MVEDGDILSPPSKEELKIAMTPLLPATGCKQSKEGVKKRHDPIPTCGVTPSSEGELKGVRG